jgi:hypothetical protein
MKITDKRMFTADGELREDEPEKDQAGPQPDASQEAASEAEVAPEPEPSLKEGDQIPREATFAHLVAVLAEPVALYLGDMELPDGRSAQNLDLARFHIDLLSVLKDKTAASLTAEESAGLEELLYGLRLRYVQKRG